MKIVYILFFISSTCFSQQIVRWNINILGNSNTETGEHYSHSVGQSSIVGLSSNENYSLRQGFQQPIEIFPKPTDFFPNQKFKVYPNPNNGVFYIEPPFLERELYSIKLYNQLGQLVVFEDQLLGIKHFKYSNLPPGSYLLEVNYKSQKEVFNIIIIP